MTMRYGLIGRPLGHSFSARYFADKFDREGLSGFSYDLWELERIDDLTALLDAERPAGFNVTIPYKREILPRLSSLSYEARCIGAVNCVKCTPDGLEGYNTDIEGIRASLGRLFVPGDLPEAALVLGTGGASQAVQFALAEAGIPFELVSRDAMRGTLTYDALTADVIESHRLVVNATPVGMSPRADEAPALPYAFLGPGHYLFDLIYNPAETRFLRYGAERGARTLGGGLMLEVQAEASWRIWRG